MLRSAGCCCWPEASAAGPLSRAEKSGELETRDLACTAVSCHSATSLAAWLHVYVRALQSIARVLFRRRGAQPQKRGGVFPQGGRDAAASWPQGVAGEAAHLEEAEEGTLPPGGGPVVRRGPARPSQVLHDVPRSGRSAQSGFSSRVSGLGNQRPGWIINSR